MKKKKIYNSKNKRILLQFSKDEKLKELEKKIKEKWAESKSSE